MDWQEGRIVRSTATVLGRLVMNHRNSFARIALFAAGWLLVAPVVNAQMPDSAQPDPMGPPGPAQTPAPSTDASTQIADEKVDQFAAAFVAVQDIQVKATQQLNTAKDDQQATEVKATAEKQMVEAVERQGMKVEEFNRIADLMTTDLSLRTRIAEKVQARRKG
jgi:hypothetical protein